MIISASRRTDIPAFYGEWFMKRTEEGFFYRINPYNSKQIKNFSLAPDDVDAFVFWTKNPKSFMKHLDLLDAKGFNYYFQFTLNDYPKLFEPNLPSINDRIAAFIDLSARIGKEKVIWRYDPIIISNITPIEFHINKLDKLFNKLHPFTNRLTISFMDFYGKVESRLKNLSEKHNIIFEDILAETHKDKLEYLLKKITEMAGKYQIEVVTCAEKIELPELAINHGSCIDGKLINKMIRGDNSFKKDKNQRSECLCVEAVDMGMYNSCSFMCSYCYANFSEASVNNNRKNHHIQSPIFIGELNENNDIFQDSKKE